MACALVSNSQQPEKITLYKNVSTNVLSNRAFIDSLFNSGYAVSIISKYQQHDTTIVNYNFQKAPIDSSGHIRPPYTASFDKLVNKKLPDFIFKDLDGNNISSANLSGYIVHINFWSTTCGPCKAEFDDLNKLKAQYAEKKVKFIAFAPENKKEIMKVFKRKRLNYIIIPNSGSYFEQLGIDTYPVNFFVNNEGVITKVTTGASFEKNATTGKFELAVFKKDDEIIQQLLK
ncbi:TlpA disulfide reductase family protein [Danxiaibacter flavus]|uniref:TlpA disulfide reductase family protein n=1 Tax=Danxiaibacter flavus TaxID=3049108 RepID=A0ABV3ZC13_9BACT